MSITILSYFQDTKLKVTVWVCHRRQRRCCCCYRCCCWPQPSRTPTTTAWWTSIAAPTTPPPTGNSSMRYFGIWTNPMSRMFRQQSFQMLFHNRNSLPNEPGWGATGLRRPTWQWLWLRTSLQWWLGSFALSLRIPLMMEFLTHWNISSSKEGKPIKQIFFYVLLCIFFQYWFIL